jgi:hypothetical protein
MIWQIRAQLKLKSKISIRILLVLSEQLGCSKWAMRWMKKDKDIVHEFKTSKSGKTKLWNPFFLLIYNVLVISDALRVNDK